MKFEDEAKLILEAVAKTATSERTRKLARSVSGRVTTGVKSIGFRMFSEVMDRIGDPGEAPVESMKPYIAKPVSAQEAALRFRQAQASPPTEEPSKESQGSPDTTPPQTISSRPISASKRYGINRVVLLIRHPGRAFAYWEIDAQRVENGGDAWLELVDADSSETLKKVSCDPVQGKHYFDVERSDGRYVVELYSEDENQDKVLLSRSHPAQYDPDNPTGSQPPTKNEA